MSFLRPSDEPAVAIRQLGQWLEADDPAPLLIETSGSTGKPKGVVLQRDAVVASAEASARRLQGSGRWLLALPSSYVAGVQVVVRSLLAGHAPVVVDGLAIARASAGQGTDTFVSLVPTQLHRILDDPVQIAALAGMHTVLVGGGGLDARLRARAEREGIRVVVTYGSSETAGGCVYDGRALDGVQLAIDDTGRVRIGGPTLFSHYDADPGLTAECLVDGWFLTSDTGALDETGRLRITGRIDDVVISGGVKIAVPAVAERLRAHPLVDDAEVVGVPDAEWGQRVVAVLVGTAPDPELRDWVATVHPRSWAPSRFVWVEELPRLRNGKVDQQALRAAL
ncbi:O-succinylbenzoic acid--CoA ligase [Nocardioides sp. BE266]|uniref:AMP-binding protein n=1 Tax=Nocardioides sp. BE266 TaxID=2817725 RepID=UPI0028642147|nr:AMP-binding protein [Nocardioides sp. BE266]MDR7255726.1 O-succinylbenzoic acid--CoA ligase [Nocardioides sp. BE266]